MTGCPRATTIVPKERSSSNIPGLDIPKAQSPRGRAKYAPAQQTLALPREAIDRTPLRGRRSSPRYPGLGKYIRGYQYWFHRQLDYRQLAKE